MDTEVVLEFLKADLEIIPENELQDSYLLQLINSASGMIKREGISLTDSAEDVQLVTMYAAYLYRKRATADPVMPRMLRYALNNRLFSSKMGES